MRVRGTHRRDRRAREAARAKLGRGRTASGPEDRVCFRQARRRRSASMETGEQCPVIPSRLVADRPCLQVHPESRRTRSRNLLFPTSRLHFLVQLVHPFLRQQRQAQSTRRLRRADWLALCTLPFLFPRSRSPSRSAEEANITFDSLLRTELFGPSSFETDPRLRSPSSSRSHTQYTAATSPNNSPSNSKPLFSFTSPSRKTVTREGAERGLDSPTHERYSLSPVRHESQKLLMSPKRAVRQVSKVPFKVRSPSLLCPTAVPD